MGKECKRLKSYPLLAKPLIQSESVKSETFDGRLGIWRVVQMGFFARVLAGLLCCSSMHGALHAQGIPDGTTHVLDLPLRGVRGGVGAGSWFKTSIRFSDFSSVGYQPVEIVFQVPVATRADVRLNYRVNSLAATQTPDDNRLSVDIPIVVPEGTTNARWVRYLPKWMMGHGYEVIVSQDGRPLPDFRGNVGDISHYRSLGRSLDWEMEVDEELSANLLLITADAKLSRADAKVLAGLGLPWRFSTQGPWVSGSRSGARFFSGVSRPVDANACGSGGLPRDWRGYQRWDLIVLDKAGIAKIKRSQAEWKALYGWVLCGGTMAVWDVESQSELEALFDLQLTARKKLSLQGIENLGFNASSAAFARVVLLDDAKIPTASPENNGLNEVGLSNQKILSLFGVGLGAGKVISVNDLRNTQSGAATAAGKSVRNSTGFGDRLKWNFYANLMKNDSSQMLRRGVDSVLGNSEYYQWLVPGVAQPPVYVLVSLLTIFVVLVGPVAYRRTTRAGRASLMFVIAPVLALVTTVSMFAYAFAADGFSTVGRVRQITWVDGVTGDAGERVRATYFAPISPGGGLTFPGEAEVFPVLRPAELSWAKRHNLTNEPIGTVAVTESKQRFSSSFLPSRDQKQFVSHRPRFNVGRLRTQRTGAKQLELQVTNEFKVKINDAILRGRDGRYWQIENLGPGETRAAMQVNPTIASPILGRFYIEYRPVVVGSIPRSGNTRRSGLVDLPAEMSRLTGSRGVVSGGFESWLRQNLQLRSDLPPGHFVALGELTPDAVSVQKCDLEESVHYLMGTLP